MSKANLEEKVKQAVANFYLIDRKDVTRDSYVSRECLDFVIDEMQIDLYNDDDRYTINTVKELFFSLKNTRRKENRKAYEKWFVENKALLLEKEAI